MKSKKTELILLLTVNRKGAGEINATLPERLCSYNYISMIKAKELSIFYKLNCSNPYIFSTSLFKPLIFQT